MFLDIINVIRLGESVLTSIVQFIKYGYEEEKTKSGKTGGKLSEMIKKAIFDCELTTSEYNQILAMADEDGVMDSQEQNLLKQLQDLLANGTIKKIPG